MRMDQQEELNQAEWLRAEHVMFKLRESGYLGPHSKPVKLILLESN
jgi:hypothetical protein